MSEIRVRTRYYALLREIAGISEEIVTLPSGASVMDFLRRVCELHGSELRRYVLDEGGNLRSSMNVAVNGETIPREDIERTRLNDGDVVVILPPISGGSSC